MRRADFAARLVARDVRDRDASVPDVRPIARATPGADAPAAGAFAGEQRPGRRALPPADLALGLRALATLLDADLPMGRTLAAFADLAPAGWRAALPTIESAVRDGRSLSTALAASPVRIPAVVVGLVRAGE
ncbi:MAG TPA: type II secretion system F family protein, partial [Gemmatirosa sp.]